MFMIACGGSDDGSATPGGGATAGSAGNAGTGGSGNGGAGGGSAASAGAGATAGTSSGGTGAGGGAAGSGGGFAGGGGAWVAPIGIPYPTFGVNEQAADCTGCTVKQQTDLSGLSNIPAGTVIELSAGPFTGGALTLGGKGTADKPIYVRGPSATNPAVIRRVTKIQGSYLILENIDFDLSASSDGIAITNSDHVALRHSKVHDFDPGHNSTALFLGNSSDIVLLGNSIHDNGDFTFVGEQDVHGIGGSNIHRVWIVDGVMFKNRGDSAQFGHQAGNTSSDIFIGRNDISGDGENCVDIKETSNVVVSENKLHQTGFDMPLVVFHDCPVNAALIYNQLSDNGVGVSMASLETACAQYQPVKQFIIRNEFKNITNTAVEGWGSGKQHYVSGNTFGSVKTPIDLSNVAQSSLVEEGNAQVAQAYAAYQAVYGIDISSP